MKKEIKWTEELSWEEIRDYGLLWLVNTALHLFGRVIVFEYDIERKLMKVYFARCTSRGEIK